MLVTHSFLAGVYVKEKTTHKLYSCHVFFPPQIFMISWAQRTDSIISVHDDMDNTIQQSMECSQTTCRKQKYSSIIPFTSGPSSLFSVGVEKKKHITEIYRLGLTLKLFNLNLVDTNSDRSHNFSFSEKAYLNVFKTVIKSH